MEAPTTQHAISTTGLYHTFGTGQAQVQVLHGVDLQIGRGEIVVLMGPSGSGKTTLLTLIGCLRRVQRGSVNLLGRELCEASESTRMLMRRRVGFIFQAHNLHGSLSAIQNVRIGLQVHGREADSHWRAACQRALALVDLEDRLNFHPDQLSGGQKQRVAVARALVGNPEVVFADEPTAALDRESGMAVVNTLRRLADRRKTTVLMVTHDHRVLDCADRIVKMEDGRIAASENSSTSVG